jgi:hypothetical protein
MRTPGILLNLEEITANNVYSCKFIRRPAVEVGLNFIGERSENLKQ